MKNTILKIFNHETVKITDIVLQTPKQNREKNNQKR